MITYEEKFLAIGEIPPPITLLSNFPFALYRLDYDILYLSGHGPGWGNDFTKNLGKIGKDFTTEQGITAARHCTLNLLQTTRQAIGSLNNVKSILEVFGIVNCIDSFTEHSKIIDGCSKLLIDIFGESGKHARVAMGANSLPFNFSVEIKMILQLSKKNNG